MIGRILSFFSLLAIFAVLLTTTVNAQTSSPSFPNCGSSVGSPIASYTSGIHGIAGDGGNYTGSDSVYQIDSTKVLQCFCAGTKGIQTNWWKILGISKDIAQFEKSGWIYIPTGASWGLDDAPYLAFNINGTCNAQGGFTANTLGISNYNSSSITNGICGSCIWWQILLGEALALILFYGLSRKNAFAQKRKYLFGLGIGIAAYIIFLLLNRHCFGLGTMHILWLFIPCKYFWVVDGVLYLILSSIFKYIKKKTT